MAETVNISEMALRIGQKIFSKFGWDLSDGALDENFPCQRLEDHKNKTAKTHPTDCVFKYSDPYSMEGVYLLTDMKSYASSTLESKDLNPVIRRIADAVECASTSKVWHDRYVAGNEKKFRIHGLLFIYNHDGEYDKDFREKIKLVLPKALNLPASSRIYVVGPDDISYLMSIVTDLYRVQSDNSLPALSAIRFYSWDQETQFAAKIQSACATIENLIGPMLVITFDRYADNRRHDDYIIYYRASGESPEEFEFLLDYLFRRSLVAPENRILLRGPFLCDSAEAYFNEAKKRLLSRMYDLEPFKERLDQIKIERLPLLYQSFSTEQIGLDRRK